MNRNQLRLSFKDMLKEISYEDPRMPKVEKKSIKTLSDKYMKRNKLTNCIQKIY